ncbi:MAG: hypothetical protein QM766_19215 [Burkholderiaceae bacterium]
MIWLHWTLGCIIWVLAVLLIGSFLGFDRTDEDEGAIVCHGKRDRDSRAGRAPLVLGGVSARMARRWRERVAETAWCHRRLDVRRSQRR